MLLLASLEEAAKASAIEAAVVALVPESLARFRV